MITVSSGTLSVERTVLASRPWSSRYSPVTRRKATRKMSVLEMQTAASDLRVEYDKRLMLVSGRANRELAAKIADKLGVELGGRDTQDVRQRRGLLPLRGVGAGGGRVHRPADLREHDEGLTPNDALMELICWSTPPSAGRRIA